MAYVLRMDQQSAKELAEQGGTILLLDVPMGTHIGFDQQVQPVRCSAML